MSDLDTEHKNLLEEALSEKGLRLTRQREQIFTILMDKRDHPTADEVYARARSGMPTISLATVYNCLETLVDCQLVRQVNFEREPTRYCPNLRPHAHFYDRASGEVIDIDLSDDLMEQLKKALPGNCEAENIELAYRGFLKNQLGAEAQQPGQARHA